MWLHWDINVYFFEIKYWFIRFLPQISIFQLIGQIISLFFLDASASEITIGQTLPNKHACDEDLFLHSISTLSLLDHCEN